jgi:hypothetical protein
VSLGLTLWSHQEAQRESSWPLPGHIALRRDAGRCSTMLNLGDTTRLGTARRPMTGPDYDAARHVGVGSGAGRLCRQTPWTDA